MADPVTITLEMTLHPEVADTFCAGMRDALKETATRPGFISIRLARSTEEPNRIVLIEVWQTRQAYDDYIAWRTERGDMDGMATMLAAPPRLTHWPILIAAV